MKKAVIFAGAAGLVWLAASVLRGDKRLLMKASQELIDLASAPAPPSDIAILKRVEKMARHLHFDIQFQAELDGRVYEGRSLNEARSFLMGWLKSESGRAAGKTSPQSGAGPRFEAKGLAVRLLPPNPPSDIQADRAGPLEKPAAPQRSGSSRQAVPTNKRAENLPAGQLSGKWKEL